jgi:hypothetical protein
MDGKIKIWTLAGKQLLIELRAVGDEESMLMMSSSNNNNSLYNNVKTMGVKGISTLNTGV